MLNLSKFIQRKVTGFRHTQARMPYYKHVGDICHNVSFWLCQNSVSGCRGVFFVPSSEPIHHVAFVNLTCEEGKIMTEAWVDSIDQRQLPRHKDLTVYIDMTGS